MHKNPQKIVVFEERKTTDEEMGKKKKKEDKPKIFVRNFFFVFVKINDRDKASKKIAFVFLTIYSKGPNFL